jgi:DNA-binding MarR family transcriptional regulator
MPRRLTPVEYDAWHGFVRMRERLYGRVSRELQAESCLSVGDYRVLVRLAEAPEGRMRFSELARSVEWEPSRMSHQVSRMAKRRLVRREGYVQGGHRAFVVITPAGRGAIAEAAPCHAGTVRRLFVDLLTPGELEALCRISRRVLEQLEK